MLCHNSFRICTFIAAAGFFCAPVTSFGQVSTGAITGIITDPSGAAAVNVQVTAIQVETNTESKTVTNGDGLYRIQALQPGAYKINFEGAGFKRLVQTDITLRVGDVLPVNATLQIGQVSDSVQVTSQATMLETETSSNGTVPEGETLYKMPLYQRYVLNTLNLTPGMTMNGYSYGGSLGGFNIGGQRSSGTAVFEDGVLGNDPQSSTGNDIKPVENSVGEVKVVTGTLPAEYGHTTGGVVTVVKKGGTNEVHIMAADLGRTRRMTHRQFFNAFKTSDPQPGAPAACPRGLCSPMQTSAAQCSSPNSTTAAIKHSSSLRIRN